MSSYNAGIIGTGGVAGLGLLGVHDEEKIGNTKFETSHAGGYLATDEVDLVAVADIDEEKLNRFGEVWEIAPNRRYTSHQQMLTKENLDIVSVCTPAFLHHDHVVDVAHTENGPGVIWCEKPIASSVTDAQRMIEVCEEWDTELVVNHSFRFAEKIQQLGSLVENDLIGDVKAVNAQFRRELMRTSTHLFDMIIFLLESRANRVSGYINGENDAVDALGGTDVDDAGGGGFIIMDDGTFVTVDCTVARDISSMTIQFVGTEGKLYLNNDDGEWRYWHLEDGTHVEEPLPGIDEPWDWDHDYKRAFPNAVAHIVDILEGRDVNRSPGVEAARSLEIMIGLYISHYTASQVSLPLDRPLQDVSITSW